MGPEFWLYFAVGFAARGLVVARQFLRQLPCHMQHPRLGNAVRRSTFHPLMSGYRGNVDDRTAVLPLTHLPGGGCCHVPYAFEVDVHDIIVIVFGQPQNRSRLFHPGIIDDDVERSCICNCLFDAGIFRNVDCNG